MLVMAGTGVRGASMVGVVEAITVVVVRGASTLEAVWVVACGTLAVLTERTSDLPRRTGKAGFRQLE